MAVILKANWLPPAGYILCKHFNPVMFNVDFVHNIFHQ